MGVLNITQDSFSDGGEFLNPEDAIKKGLELSSQGNFSSNFFFFFF